MELADRDGRVKGTARGIGPIGTGARIVGGLALLALAVAGRPAGLLWGLRLHELLLGLVVLPAVSLTIGLLARGYADGPLRLTGPAWIAANLVVIVGLFATPYTAGGVALFYGTSLLIAAWRGQPDCEATIWSNLLLRRDDQLGCPTLSPIDALEARRRQ